MKENRTDLHHVLQSLLQPFADSTSLTDTVSHRHVVAMKLAKEIEYWRWEPNEFLREFAIIFATPITSPILFTKTQPLLGAALTALKKEHYLDANGSPITPYVPEIKNRRIFENLNAEYIQSFKPSITTSLSTSHRTIPSSQTRNKTTTQKQQQPSFPISQPFPSSYQYPNHLQHHQAVNPMSNLHDIMASSQKMGLRVFALDKTDKLEPYGLRIAQALAPEKADPTTQSLLSIINNSNTTNKDKVAALQGLFSFIFFSESLIILLPSSTTLPVPLLHSPTKPTLTYLYITPTLTLLSFNHDNDHHTTKITLPQQPLMTNTV